MYPRPDFVTVGIFVAKEMKNDIVTELTKTKKKEVTEEGRERIVRA